MDDLDGMSGLAIAQATVVTTCVVLMTWLGLVGRPGRPTLLWTLGYFFALLGVYGSFVSAAMGVDVIMHPVAQTIGFGLPLLVWSGLRALHGRRAYAWAGVVQAVVSCAIVALTTLQPIGPLVLRVVFLGVALSTAAVAVEALRGPTRSSRYTQPIIAASLLILALGVVGVAYPLAAGGGVIDPDVQVIFNRTVIITSLVFIITATVSLLFFANRRPGANDILEALDAFMPADLMRAFVRERMLRARARGEGTWTFIEICIDDVADLRDAGSEWSFNRIVERFETIVTQQFPAEVDLARVSPGCVQIFTAQSSAMAREHVRNVLNALTAPDAEPATIVSISASAGIVPVSVAEDTYERLSEMSAAAVDEAQHLGGNRWVRREERSAATATTA